MNKYENNVNKERFKECLEDLNKEAFYNGIGTYKERTLHKVLKNYYEKDTKNQEIKLGSYIADIFKGNQIIEIQTRAFNKLVNKLDQFLELENVNVKIVFPIAKEKKVCWVDKETFEVVDERKSPRKGRIHDIIPELYKIKRFLDNPKLKIVLLFLKIKDVRLLNGWGKDKKRGSSRYDRIPIDIIEEIEITDYRMFIPYEENKEFSATDLSKELKWSLLGTRVLLTILNYLKLVEVVRKDKRANIYRLKAK